MECCDGTAITFVCEAITSNNHQITIKRLDIPLDITLLMCLLGRRTLAVVDSAYTTAMAGSKNKRFNPEKFAKHGRDAKLGGPDTAAQEAANQYDAERAVWHAQHVHVFRTKYADALRAKRHQALTGQNDDE